MKGKLNTNEWINRIVNLLNQANTNVVRSVNQTMVYTYYEIGRIIIDEEQKGTYGLNTGNRYLKSCRKD